MTDRPDKRWSFGVALENPEQQVGGFVRFPAVLNDVLTNQYNTGRAELRTPNAAPDTIVKVAWNGAIGKHKLHVDAGSVFRFFRSVDARSVTLQRSATGVGGNFNLSFDVTKKLRMLGNAYVSSGGGRYIGGLVPDVIVRADGDSSPVKSHSWITGPEWTAGWSQTIWSGEDAGSPQYATQYSWLKNDLRSAGPTIPGTTSAPMVFTQLRYNLP